MGVWQNWVKLSVPFTTSAGLAVKQSEDSFFNSFILFFFAIVKKKKTKEKKKDISRVLSSEIDYTLITILPDPSCVIHALDLMPFVKSMAVWKEGMERLLVNTLPVFIP